MSRIGKMPVPIGTGVKVDVGPSQATVQGPKGKLTVPVPESWHQYSPGARSRVEKPGIGMFAAKPRAGSGTVGGWFAVGNPGADFPKIAVTSPGASRFRHVAERHRRRGPIFNSREQP